MAIKWDDASSSSGPVIRWDDTAAPELQASHAPSLAEREDLGQGVGIMPQRKDKYLMARRAIEYGMGGAAALTAAALATPETLGAGAFPAAATAYPLGMVAGRETANLLLGPEPILPPRTSKTTGFLPGVREAVGNLPRSIDETVRGVSTFPVDIAHRAAVVGPLTAANEVGLGMVEQGKNLFSAEKWKTEPAQNLATAAMVYKPARASADLVPRTITPMERLQMRKIDPAASKIIEDPTSRQVVEGARRFAPQKASDIQSPAVQAREIKNDFEGLTTAAKLRDSIELVRDGETVRGKLPTNKEENLAYLNQATNEIGRRIDEISSAASEGGLKVSPEPAIKELEQVTISNGFSEAQVKQAESLLGTLYTIRGEGGYRVSAALNRMTGLNNDIKGLMTGKNVSGDSPQILGMTANKLKESLNSTLETVQGGEQFGSLRKSLGQILSLEKRSLKELEKNVSKDLKNNLSVFDYVSAAQMAKALAHTSGQGLVTAAATYITGKTLELLKSPDRAVRKAWRAADRVNAKTGSTALPTQEVVAPPPPTTYFDKSTGTQVPIRDAYTVRLPSQEVVPPTTYFDKATGTQVPIRYGK